MLALIFGAIHPAQAETITFWTEGGFNSDPSSPNASFTFGSGPDTATIYFTGLTLNSVDGPTFTGLGNFSASATGLGATVPGGTTFTYYIYQTVPATDMVTLTSVSMSGTITPGGSTVFLDFGGLTATASGSITWTAFSPLGIPSPPNPTTAQGAITGVPEPSTWASLLAGAALLGTVVRRRISNR